MKICILTHTSAWGGVEVHTVGLAKTLRDRGHEVAIVQLRHEFYGALRNDLGVGIELVSVALTKPIAHVGWFEWRRILTSLNAKVCVFEKGDLDAGSLRLDLAARATFSSYVTIEQLTCDPMPARSSKRYFGGVVRGLGLWWYRLLFARYSRSWAPHRIVCVSESSRMRLIAQYRFAAHKLITIHNGFDVSKFKSDRDLRQKMRARWGVPENALVFGAVARLSKIKGFDLAINLLRNLTTQCAGHELRIVLVGCGLAEQELRRQADEAGIAHLVVFPGFSDRPWEAYSAFDIFIMPSLNEGLPLALLEAMACGCPSIAMGVGGVPEVIVDNGLGWLVPPGDRNGFHSAMEAAVRNRGAALIEMGQKARRHVLSCFRSEDQFQKHAELIENDYCARKVGRLSFRHQRIAKPV